MLNKNANVFTVSVLEDCDCENETVAYVNALKTVAEAVHRAKHSTKTNLTYFNVIDEKNDVTTLVLYNTGEKIYTLKDRNKLDYILSVNFIDEDAENEVFWTPDTMCYWLFLALNGNYDFDEEHESVSWFYE